MFFLDTNNNFKNIWSLCLSRHSREKYEISLCMFACTIVLPNPKVATVPIKISRWDLSKSIRTKRSSKYSPIWKIYLGRLEKKILVLETKVVGILKTSNIWSQNFWAWDLRQSEVTATSPNWEKKIYTKINGAWSKSRGLLN